MTIPDEEHLLDLIYGAAVQPTLWPEVLSRVISAVGGDGGALARMDVETGAGAAIVPPGSDPAVVKVFFEHYCQINPLQIVPDSTTYLTGWQLCIKRDEELVPRDYLVRSEYYNDFLTKISANWGLIIRLGLRDMDVAAISVGRGLQRGRFEQFEVAKAARLQPHLVRAFRLSEEFASIPRRNAEPFAGLPESPTAMIMLDRQRRVLHTNPSGDAMLMNGTVLKTIDGRLTPANGGTSDAFAAIMARAGNRDWDRRGAGSIRIAAEDGDAPLTITASPLTVEHGSVFAPRATILVTVADPNAEATTRAARLARRFALTAAEVRLAACLLDGITLRDASAAFGVSINTVRTQLASLFAKTETRRQADLVRRLMQAEGAEQGRR